MAPGRFKRVLSSTLGIHTDGIDLWNTLEYRPVLGHGLLSEESASRIAARLRPNPDAHLCLIVV